MKPARSLARLPAWAGGGPLAARFVLLSLALLLLVQAAGFGVVRSTIDVGVQAQLDAELQVGERVWQRLLETHAQRLHQAATLLAADYGFRSAVGSNDVATIGSVLDNHGARIGASVVALLDTRFAPRATQAATAEALPATLLHDIAARVVAGGERGGLALVGGQVLQFVAVPIRAPVTIGWVMMGFPLGQEMVADLRALSGLEAVLLAAAQGQPARVVAGTLPAPLAEAVAGRDPGDAKGAVQLGRDALRLRRVELPATGGHVRALLLRSVAEVAAPLHRLQLVLGVITLCGLLLFALGSMWAARRVTAPLRTLVSASEGLARGDYAQPLQGKDRRDEIGELARAFDSTRATLATHQAQLRQLAYNDRLTGLPNRAGFGATVQQAMAARTEGGHLAVLMLDLDRFKHVNDVLGYRQGDRVLEGVARRLVEEVARPGDVVARLGGDEFALMLPDADRAVAGEVAKRLGTSFVRPLVLDDQTVDLSAGVGIACWPADAGDADALLARAEVAMYGAKHAREALRFYDPAQDSDSAHTLSLLSDLRRAMDAGELRLYLQPKVELATRRLVGAEALVRWQHPLRGLVPPMAFIPFAEQTGFVRHLTQWVFEEAARQWRALSGTDGLCLSVNLSTRDLTDAELPARFDALLRRHGVPESGICLEITESAIMDDPARALATLDALSARGYSISIDDFGTGYSSLSYLRRLPVDELKIDRGFVQGMARNADDAKIVRSTIDLAHNLGLRVVAEGIEDEGTLESLARLGCEQGQGYHLARPLPLDEFQVWARRWVAQTDTASA